MNYETRIVYSSDETLIIKNTQIAVVDVLRKLSEDFSYENLLKVYPELSNLDISACLEYATELILISDFTISTKKINENYSNRQALAKRIRALKGNPPSNWPK